MATRRDVARLAGVSLATVSNALNGNKFVSDDLLSRVREAAAELGYRPNFYARQLKSGGNIQIGVLVDELDNPFFWQVLQGINEIALKEQYGIHFIHCDENIDEHIEQFIYKKMDGVFSFLNLKNDLRVLNALAAEGIAVVVGGYPHPVFSAVRIDEDASMRLAMSHLRSLGHRDIAYLSGYDADWDDVGSCFKRQYAALFGEEADPRLMSHCVMDAHDELASGAAAMQRLLDAGARFSAIVCRSDHAAMGALRILHEHGIRVPADVSVVGHDDVAIAAHTYPPLTTVRIPMRQLGLEAMRIMINHIRNGEHNSAELQPELTIRRSTGPRP